MWVRQILHRQECVAEVRRTADEMAELLEIDRDAMDGLLKYLRVLGLAKFRGERPNPNGRGKGAHVYEIVGGAGKMVAADLRKLEK